MAKQVIRRQGSSSEHAVFTGAEGEWTHDNTLNTGRFHDGNLAGGYPALLSNNINELSTSTNLDGSNFGELIVADSTSSSFTITLPDPSVVGSGWQVAIKKAVDANSVTVSPFDGEGIDGDTSVVLENAENALQIRTDGTSWYALRLNNFDDAQEILYDNSTSGLSATTVQGAIDEVVSDSDDFATLDGGNTFNGNQTLNDDLSVNGDVSFQSYSFPSTDGASGEALLTDGAGNLSFGAVGGDIIQEGNSSVEVIDSGTGRIEFTTDGSEAMRIDEDGNVGIGTSSPDAPLHTLKDSFDPQIIVERPSESTSFEHLVSTDALIIRQGENSSNGIRIDSDEFRFNSGYGSIATAYGCRAWVNFDGDNESVRASGNISSVVRNRSGDYTVNFATAMPDNDYAVSAIARGYDGDSATWVQIKNENALLTTSVQITTAIVNDGNPRDREIITLVVFR